MNINFFLKTSSSSREIFSFQLRFLQARIQYIGSAAAAIQLLKLNAPSTAGSKSCRCGIESSIAALLAAADEFSRMQHNKGGLFRLSWNGKDVALQCQRLCCRLLRVLDIFTSSSHDQKRLFTREMAVGLSKADYSGHIIDNKVFEDDEKVSAGTFLFPLGYPFDFFRYSQ